ncbi:hypothetical protein H5410_045801, partial [Solanum commersonii]
RPGLHGVQCQIFHRSRENDQAAPASVRLLLVRIPYTYHEMMLPLVLQPKRRGRGPTCKFTDAKMSSRELRDRSAYSPIVQPSQALTGRLETRGRIRRRLFGSSMLPMSPPAPFLKGGALSSDPLTSTLVRGCPAGHIPATIVDDFSTRILSKIEAQYWLAKYIDVWRNARNGSLLHACHPEAHINFWAKFFRVIARTVSPTKADNQVARDSQSGQDTRRGILRPPLLTPSMPYFSRGLECRPGIRTKLVHPTKIDIWSHSRLGECSKDCSSGLVSRAHDPRRPDHTTAASRGLLSALAWAPVHTRPVHGLVLLVPSAAVRKRRRVRRLGVERSEDGGYDGPKVRAANNRLDACGESSRRNQPRH